MSIPVYFEYRSKVNRLQLLIEATFTAHESLGSRIARSVLKPQQSDSLRYQ